jgi:hypothetical protein
MVEKVREALRIPSGKLARNELISVHMTEALPENTGTGIDVSF